MEDFYTILYRVTKRLSRLLLLKIIAKALRILNYYLLPKIIANSPSILNRFLLLKIIAKGPSMPAGGVCWLPSPDVKCYWPRVLAI